MEKNFKIDKNVALIGNGYYYDLHNLYDLVKILLDIQKKEVRLIFKRSAITHNQMNNPEFITMIFTGVIVFSTSSGIMLDTSINVDELGYKNPEDNDMNWLVSEEKINKNDHLIIRLEGDEFIRIFGEKVEVTTGV